MKMRYSAKPKYRKYIKGYGFLWFEEVEEIPIPLEKREQVLDELKLFLPQNVISIV